MVDRASLPDDGGLLRLRACSGRTRRGRTRRGRVGPNRTATPSRRIIRRSWQNTFTQHSGLDESLSRKKLIQRKAYLLRGGFPHGGMLCRLVLPRRSRIARDLLRRGDPQMSKVGNARLRRATYFPATGTPLFNSAAGAPANVSRREERKRPQERGEEKMIVLRAAMRTLLHVCYGAEDSVNRDTGDISSGAPAIQRDGGPAGYGEPGT